MLNVKEKKEVINLIKSEQLVNIDLALTILENEFDEVEMVWGGEMLWGGLLLGEEDLMPVTCMVLPYRGNTIESLGDIKFDCTVRSTYQKRFLQMVLGPMYLLHNRELYEVLQYATAPQTQLSPNYLRLTIYSQMKVPF